MKNTNKAYSLIILLAIAILSAGCGSGGDATPTGVDAGSALSQTPDGRILTANQASNTISVVDVAKELVLGTVATGSQPHHVVSSSDGKEFWVSLYGEKRVQIFDSGTLKEIGSVDVKAVNDDLTFDPQDKMLYISLGQNNAVAVVDAVNRTLVQTVTVGKVPHGVKVTPDGQYLLVTNTADNTVSLLKLGGSEVTVQATIKTGANPFEVYVSPDSKTAYVSDFLGNAISVIDIATEKTVGSIRSGEQPAMLWLQSDSTGQKLWVANTGSAEVWVLDPIARKLITRIPVGKGAHGIVMTPTNKAFVTNSTDNTLSILDGASQKAIATLSVGNNPNGLTFLPNAH